MTDRRTIHIGYFPSKEAASVAAVEARNRYFTHNDLDREAS